jgi:branched-chain amino acid aminotransferase
MYTCDEAFFSGTAAGITSIISVDSVDIGDGKKGPITSKIATEYKMIVSGKDHSHSGWLTFVK